MTKERLDSLLVQRQLVESRERAKRLIMAGLVYSGVERLDKPGMKVSTEITLSVKETLKYVSRGGYKLEKALEIFDTTIKQKIVVDIGSSTGGFTDCALQHGAAFIYAIDVGTNQLAWKLRNDNRVSVHEKTNFRYISDSLFVKGLPNFAVIDVSFISLRHILPTLKNVLQHDSHIIVLIKPQFEARKEQVGKKGIIKDKQVHCDVLDNFMHFVKDLGFTLKNITHSPITGATGNIEFLGHFTYHKVNGPESITSSITIKEIVDIAHKELASKGGLK